MKPMFPRASRRLLLAALLATSLSAAVSGHAGEVGTSPWGPDDEIGRLVEEARQRWPLPCARSFVTAWPSSASVARKRCKTEDRKPP